MTIPRIHVKEVNIPNIYLPDWMSRQPNVDHLVPPVVLNIGNPIVDIPGCVKMHRDNQYHNNGLPIDRNLVENDPDQAMIVCDAEVPSYDAMNFEPEQLIITREAEVPNVRPPDVEAPEVPPTGDLVKQKEVPCPGPGNLRVGDITQSGEERVVGHKLSDDGKVCETIYEPTTAVEKFIPSTNQATNALAIAVIATAGATATPIILRIVKPILTKIWKTIQKKTGKKVAPPTRSEIISNKYREKKGLPPLKRKN